MVKFLLPARAPRVGAMLLVLAGCSPAAPAPAPADAAAASPVDQVCARARALGCASFDCAMVRTFSDSVAPRCATQRDAFLRCAAQASGATCADLQAATLPACASQRAAFEGCGAGGGDDGGATPDASAPDVMPPGVPAPNDWLGPPRSVGLVFEGAGNPTPESGMGTASLGIGPIGSPANAYILSFESMGSAPVGAPINCRVGLIYDPAARSYSFSGAAALTQPCVAMLLEDSTTLTFTGASVALDPAGATVVRVNLTAAGFLARGEGVMQITFPPR